MKFHCPINAEHNTTQLNTTQYSLFLLQTCQKFSTSGQKGKMSHCPGPNPLKFSSFFSHPEKPWDIFLLLTGITLFVGLLISIPLVVYLSFSTRYPPFRLSPTIRNHSFIPDPDPTNVSHIVFGIGGTSSKWPNRRAFVDLWWEPNVMRGFVWLDEELGKKNTVQNNTVPFRVSSPEWKRFGYSSSRSAVRIARIIWDSFRLGLPNVRWFVMGDDDTVYFAQNLVSVLARYDHREMWYVGENSESVEQDVMHGYGMAFGGGGFAVSYPLAERLVAILDGCLERYHYFYGSDERVCACISEIGVRLSRESGFHQFDIRGNPYGLLAAHPLAPLVSLHHLDYVDAIFPKKTRIGSLNALMEAYRLDPGRTLQQSFCYDTKRKWSFSVSWGYTIQIYPVLLSAKDLQTPLQTFKTWRSWSNGPFTFNTRQFSSNPCERPVVYFLDRVEEVDTSGTRTWYKMAEPEKICGQADYAHVMEVKSILVSALKMAPDYWHKAPRRQCGEIMNSTSAGSGDVHIRVRKCRQGESLSV